MRWPRCASSTGWRARRRHHHRSRQSCFAQPGQVPGFLFGAGGLQLRKFRNWPRAGSHKARGPWHGFAPHGDGEARWPPVFQHRQTDCQPARPKRRPAPAKCRPGVMVANAGFWRWRWCPRSVPKARKPCTAVCKQSVNRQKAPKAKNPATKKIARFPLLYW